MILDAGALNEMLWMSVPSKRQEKGGPGVRTDVARTMHDEAMVATGEDRHGSAMPAATLATCANGGEDDGCKSEESSEEQE